jgi:hypothetical protein
MSVRGRGASILTPIDEQLCEQSRWDFTDLSALYINCTLKRSPEVSNTQGLADRSIAILERERGIGRGHPRGRPQDRHRRPTGHDRARLGAGRLARDLREGAGRGHPRAAQPDLAGREVVDLHPGHRALVRQQPPAQRRRAVRVLRTCRWMHHHRQRGRRQALRDEEPQHDVLDLEPDAPCENRQGRRGHPRAWHPAHVVGCRRQFDYPNPEYRT